MIRRKPSDWEAAFVLFVLFVATVASCEPKKRPSSGNMHAPTED